MKELGTPQTTLREGFNSKGIFARVMRTTEQPEPMDFWANVPMSEKFRVIEEQFDTQMKRSLEHEEETQKSALAESGFPRLVRIIRF